MLLHQVDPYRSIVQLPDTRLPDFTLLTGVNGAGKTHLLRALTEGKVTADVAPTPTQDIRYYDWNTFVPSSTAPIEVNSVYSDRDFILQQVDEHRRSRLTKLTNRLRDAGMLSDFASDPWRARTLSRDTIISIYGTSPQVVAAADFLDGSKSTLIAFLRQQSGQDRRRLHLVDELESSPNDLFDLDNSFFDKRPYTHFDDDMFQHSFANLFLSYFVRDRDNRLRQLDAAQGRETDAPPLTDEEFKSLNGEPPWIFVNGILKRAEMDFEIDHPTSYSITRYKPTLTKISTGQPVDFGDLSSGEKVLMSFAFCLYYSEDDRHSVMRPKLLLFDEIDAPLHPSMARMLISTITEVIVKQYGIGVIFVTHSPSTVAVAPDESIHLIEVGTNLIGHDTKRRAIATLTAEIPTMSIDFSGRRQVFVESDLDAERYSLLYQLLSGEIASERSLAFVGVGTAGLGASGSAQVLSTVTALASGGNVSVLGLIDWDAKNDPTDRVLVLGSGERYAIENYLLDPVLVLAAALNERPGLLADWGLQTSLTYTGIATADSADLQAATSELCSRVLARMKLTGPAAGVDVAYQNGITLKHDGRYLTANGHSLETAILEVVDPLRRYQTPKLLWHMIDIVLRNHLGLVPRTLFRSFLDLCEMQIN